MNRKLKLNPIQGEILRLLEEAGSEELQTIIVTFSGYSEISIQQSLDSLIDAGFIFRNGTEIILTELGRETLTR